jgi:hypothetical protein
MPVQMHNIKINEVHRVLIKDAGGWMDIVPGTFNFVWGSLVTAQDEYITQSGMYVFETQDGERYSVPAECLMGLQRHAVVVEPPIEEEPPVEPEGG